MTKKFDLKPTIVLSAICVVIVALLAVVNLFTAPIIEAQKNAAANAALLEVFPNGEGFEEVKTGLNLKKTNTSEEEACQSVES